MTRTDSFKALYFLRTGGIVVAGLGGGLAVQHGETGLAAALLIAFVLLLFSGRVQAHFWSDLLAGLHYLNRRDYPRCKTHTQRFLGALRSRPWLKHLIWLAPSSYTANAEVLALNNLAAAEIGLDEHDSARAHLTRALGLDPKCPPLYRNMGVLVRQTDSDAEAAPWFERARALGFRGDWTDRRALASQRNNAPLRLLVSAKRQ